MSRIPRRRGHLQLPAHLVLSKPDEHTDLAWLRLAVPNRLPFPLPFQKVIQGDSAVFSPDDHNKQSSENTEKLRDVTVVAPTGFEPVFQP